MHDDHCQQYEMRKFDRSCRYCLQMIREYDQKKGRI